LWGAVFAFALRLRSVPVPPRPDCPAAPPQLPHPAPLPSSAFSGAVWDWVSVGSGVWDGVGCGDG